jgi:P pilus assembly chaperone PapD
LVRPTGWRFRIADLKLVDAGGATIAARDGLVGYVLPGSTMSWPLRGTARAPSEMKIVAESELGPVHAPIKLQPAR